MTDDERAQAYEDQYWAERVAVSTWSAETAAMFLDAVAMSTAPRAEAKAEVIHELKEEISAAEKKNAEALRKGPDRLA